MDTLILSCGTGGGHNAAGKAIREELHRRGHKADMFNPYELRSHRLASRIDHTYIGVVQHTPSVFGAAYHLGNAYRRLPFRSPVYFANHGMADILAAYLAMHPYDIIVFPHLFPGEMLTQLRRRGAKLPPCVFVATDYTCIPFTEEIDCDAYVIPTADLAENFIARGLPASKLHALGIPVSAPFRTPPARETAIEALGLDPDTEYLLVSGGSMGASKLDEALDLLQHAAERRKHRRVIAVCGSNQALCDRLHLRYGDSMLVLGHTDKMAAYMAASSLYITKPGGLSSTEAAVMGTPLLHLPPIPGCETLNLRYFSQRGMSLPFLFSEDAQSQILSMLDNEALREGMCTQQHRYIPHDAAGSICDLLESLAAKTHDAKKELHAT